MKKGRGERKPNGELQKMSHTTVQQSWNRIYFSFILLAEPLNRWRRGGNWRTQRKPLATSFRRTLIPTYSHWAQWWRTRRSKQRYSYLTELDPSHAVSILVKGRCPHDNAHDVGHHQHYAPCNPWLGWQSHLKNKNKRKTLEFCS